VFHLAVPFISSATTLLRVRVMSALPPKADIDRQFWNVR
jgi:hypothetical protein